MTADTRIPSEIVADHIRDGAGEIWLLVDPRVGTGVDWDSIRGISAKMRKRRDVKNIPELLGPDGRIDRKKLKKVLEPMREYNFRTDDLCEALNEHLERHNVVEVHTSKPACPFGFETQIV